MSEETSNSNQYLATSQMVTGGIIQPYDHHKWKGKSISTAVLILTETAQPMIERGWSEWSFFNFANDKIIAH